MECTVYGRSDTREQGLAFARAIGVADDIDGRIVPLVEAHITTTDDGWTVGSWTGDDENTAFEAVPGWFFNVRYYGSSAAALANGGDPNSADLFEQFPGLIALTEMRTGEPMIWRAISDDIVPPCYECAAYGVTLYPPDYIATPANEIAK